jgi:hypothetical protein
MPEMQNAVVQSAMLYKFNRKNHLQQKDLQFQQKYYSQMRAAYRNDPFGIFYPAVILPSDMNRPIPGEKEKFLRITFRHKSFDECKLLISMPEINQPSGTANSTGKQNTNMFFTDQ